MEIVTAPEFSRLTTLGLGGRGVALVRPSDAREMEKLPEVIGRMGGQPVILGRGSNLLAHDGVLPFTVIRLPKAADPVCEGPQPDGRVRVRVEAGLPLGRLLNWCRDKGFSGLEGMSGIPGEVGGAVAMNAGSYGCEIGSRLLGISVFSSGRGHCDLDVSRLEMSYRHFGIPEMERESWWMITEAVLGLTPAGSEAVAAAMAATLRRKRATQPVRARSAGCIFKNPPGGSAGKLLDEAGLRGKGRGGMRFSLLHANFLVNEGNGSAQAAFELIAEAQERIVDCFGVSLSLEVKVLPC